MNTPELSWHLPAVEEVVAADEHSEPKVISRRVTDGGNTIEFVEPPKQGKERTGKAEEKPAQPKLNRAQRRQLSRYIAHKAQAQLTTVKHRKPWITEQALTRCPHCNLLFLGPIADRCQCQVRMEHRCMMCGAVFMASQREYRTTNACSGCAEALQEQWDNEEASRDAAYQRYEEVSEAEMDAVTDEVFEQYDDLQGGCNEQQRTDLRRCPQGTQ